MGDVASWIGDNLAISVLICLLTGYLFGNIMSTWFVCKFFRGVDPRYHASWNVGGTNCKLITGSGKLMLLVIMIDMAKGAIPVIVFGVLTNAYTTALSLKNQDLAINICWVTLGFGTMIGHVYPFWLGFKGGKAQATLMGVILATFPHYTGPGVIITLCFMVPYSFALCSEKISQVMLNLMKGNKVLVFTLFFLLAPAGLCVAFQATRDAIQSEDGADAMVYAGLPFTIGLFAKFAFVVFLFRSHINDAAKNKTEPFWTEEWAKKEGTKCPCREFNSGCNICQLYAICSFEKNSSFKDAEGGSGYEMGKVPMTAARSSAALSELADELSALTPEQRRRRKTNVSLKKMMSRKSTKVVPMLSALS